MRNPILPTENCDFYFKVTCGFKQQRKRKKLQEYNIFQARKNRLLLDKGHECESGIPLYNWVT